jgi:hypothetical protein
MDMVFVGAFRHLTVFSDIFNWKNKKELLANCLRNKKIQFSLITLFWIKNFNRVGQVSIGTSHYNGSHLVIVGAGADCSTTVELTTSPKFWSCQINSEL